MHSIHVCVYLRFADADTGIYHNAAPEYEEQRKTKSDITMFNLDNFSFRRK